MSKLSDIGCGLLLGEMLNRSRISDFAWMLVAATCKAGMNPARTTAWIRVTRRPGTGTVDFYAP